MLGIGLGLWSNVAASGGGGGGVAATSTLTDNFNDNSLDATKWTTGVLLDTLTDPTGTTIAETNGRTEITAAPAGGHGTGRISLNNYSLQGDSFFVRVANIASAQSVEDVYLGYGQNTSNYYSITLEAGTAYCKKNVAGSSTLIGTFVLSGEQWFRIRETGGTVFWDTALGTASNPPLSGDWTNGRKSVVVDAGVPVTSGKMCFQVTSFGALASPTVFQFDGFNTAA